MKLINPFWFKIIGTNESPGTVGNINNQKIAELIDKRMYTDILCIQKELKLQNYAELFA